MGLNLNVWLVNISDQLPLEDSVQKNRTIFIANELVKRGHNVLWWSSCFDHIKKKWLINEEKEILINSNFRIKTIKGSGYKKNISLARFINNRIISLRFRKVSKKVQVPDIIITSTPSYDLAYEAVKYAKKNNIPIIIDIRDEWPDLFLTVFPKKLRRLFRILLFYEFKILKKALINSTAIVSMMNSLLEWGLRYAKRTKGEFDKVFYLGAEKIECNGSEIIKKLDLLKLQNKFVVCFIGTFVKNNNPQILIECAKKLIDKDIIFVLGGDGELLPIIKENSKNCSNVIFTGWLNKYEICSLLKNAHLGIIPSPYAREAFPNKTFSYLSHGLPIITSFHGEIKDLLEKYQIGFYYPPNDVDKLCETILYLYENKDIYLEMRENAGKLFELNFNALKIYSDYVDLIENVYNNFKLR